MKGVKLDKEQQAALAAGKGIYLEGMTSKSGKKFNATIQINADKRGLVSTSEADDKRNIKNRRTDRRRTTAARSTSARRCSDCRFSMRCGKAGRRTNGC